MPNLITITRPESEEEAKDIIYTMEHRCSSANIKYRLEGAEEAAGCDALLYPVGIFGIGMPTGVPFQVEPTEPCGACRELPKLWFQWKKNLIFDLGA